MINAAIAIIVTLLFFFLLEVLHIVIVQNMIHNIILGC